MAIAFTEQEIDKTIAMLQLLRGDVPLLNSVTRVATRCSAAINAGGKIMFCGNGGSAADSQHLAAELVGKLARSRPAMAGLALTTDTSALTAIGNDFGYECIFSRQVEGLGRAGDVLIGISTSGQSRNVALAMETAKRLCISTVAMTGLHRGRMAELADEWLPIPHTETPKIQEGHIVLGHIFCTLVEALIFDKSERAEKVPASGQWKP
jgi:D-sedoheptulose 7-phosphate isomerase